MLRDEILSLSAGRETDVLVASRIFGWREIREEEIAGPKVMYREWTGIQKVGKTRLVFPFYSTDLFFAAWDLVDWWRDPRQEGGYGELEMYCEGPPETGLWTAKLGLVGSAKAPTLPLALCRAALLAVLCPNTQRGNP